MSKSSHRKMIEKLTEPFGNFRIFNIMGFDIIQTPDTFYNMLLEKVKSAHSVHLACLVLGIGNESTRLLEALEERMLEEKQTLILADKSRNLRDNDLVKYITRKNLWKIVKLVDTGKCKIFPHAINELLGVYHLKAYIFDDEVCISGANLNDYYFTNRIDRYYLIKNRELSDYMLHKVFDNHLTIDALTKARLIRVERGFTTTGDVSIISPGIPKRNIPETSALANPYANPAHSTRLFQYTDKQEILVIDKLLKMGIGKVALSTAYLNFSKEHIRLLKPHTLTLFIPNPKANTFSGFGFLGNTITKLYEYSGLKTLRYMPKCELYEFNKPGCSFHSKGLWLFGDGFCITIIGSSNFNRRSVSVDDECNWVIMSDDPVIIAKMESEVEILMYYSKRVTMEEYQERRFHFLVILIYHILNIFL